MTNLHTKVALIAISAFLFILTGCKKDDETAATFTLDTTSLDFEWGQTKELGFTSNRLTAFADAEVPDGWSCYRSGSKFLITAPASGTTETTTGTLTLKATTDLGNTLTRTVIVSVRIPQEITPRANSVIVREPGKRFKFNALVRGNETSPSITGATGATRVWTTTETGIVNVSLENGYICFATGSSSSLIETNAVVAVTDTDGNILWSWHIWATDFDPAANPDIVGGLRVMNRNLGAFANSDASDEDALRSYGLYYQWGRKDPFVGPTKWNSTTPRALYNAKGTYTTHAYVVSDSETGTQAYSIANPNTFIAGNKDNSFDWLAAQTTAGLWNSTAKSLYDPCPAGWRVAPPTIWAGFTTTGKASSDETEFNVEGEYKYGWNFTDGEQTIFYPAAGRRSFSPSLAASSSNFTNVVNDNENVGYPVGFYWSSTRPASTGATGALVFRRAYVNPANVAAEAADYAAAGGFPLRCVAE